MVHRSRGATSPRELSRELRQRVLAWISFLELPHLTCKALSNNFTSAFQFCNLREFTHAEFESSGVG